MKTVFFGSSRYCLPVVQALLKKNILSTIVTKPQGKIAEFAIKNKIQHFFVTDKNELIFLENNLKKSQPDIAIVADFGIIIPKTIFSIPSHGTLNIHFSMLPKLRGASPIQHALLEGQKTTGISIIEMDEGLDTGNIVFQKEYEIRENETAEELYTRLFVEAAISLPEVIDKYRKGEIKTMKQHEKDASFTKILTRNDGYIPWEKIKDKKKGSEIYNTFRAYYPWPGTWTEIDIKGTKKRLKILKAHKEDENLIIDEVQLEGKTPVSWTQFQDGYSINN